MWSSERVLVLAALTLAFCAVDDAAAQAPLGEPVPVETSVHDDAWRAAAEARIEEHRKADLEVVVRDGAGNPIPDANVAVTMTRHSFEFGARAGRTRWAGQPTAADARRHRAIFEENFNTAVTIPAPGDAASDALLTWMVERDIKVRGHYLMWAPIQPERGRGGQPAEAFGGIPTSELHDRAAELDRGAIRRAAFSHLEEMIEFAGGRIVEWDAVNHIGNRNHFRYYDLFGAGIYADIMRRGRELAPHAERWVNEGNILTAGRRLENYHEIIEELVSLGAAPDGIGFMAHFRDGGFTAPAEIYERLDRFARLVPRLKLTELDIDTHDEAFQGRYMADILTVAFSHPAVTGIILWQVWGGSEAHKSLWRDDWTIKPSGEAWRDLIFDRWWTEERGTTNAGGSYETRGFLGDYEVSVEVDGIEKTIDGRLSPDGNTFRVTF